MPLKKVAKLSDLWSGERKVLNVDGKDLLLLNIDGAVHIYENRCAHQRMQLTDAKLSSGILTCPAHGWEYDAKTGKGINPKDARLKAIPFTIHEDDILVDGDAMREALKDSHASCNPGNSGNPDSPDSRLLVGPVLQSSPVADAILAAIRSLNENVTLIDRGAYIRVQVSGLCKVTRAAIESHLRRPFILPRDLEAVMPSFKGRMTITDSEVTWQSEHQRSDSGE